MRLGRERGELRHHRRAHRHAARHRADGDEVRLGGGREVDEDRDEDQQRVVEQPDEAEREGDALADERGDFGRPHVTHAGGEHGAQHPPAVHGEGGIMLNTARNRLTAASRSIIEVAGFSTA